MKNIIFIATTIIASTGINLTAMEQTGKTEESLLAGQPPEIIQQIMAGLEAKGIATGILDLSHRDLRYIFFPGVFQNLGNLERLRLSDNQLNNLPRGVFQNLVNLQDLFLENNRLENLPLGVFQGLGNLQELILSNNRLNNLPPDIFQNLGNLKWLDLSNNQLENLPPEVFQNLGNLQWLFLRDNQLNNLSPDIFQNLKRLYWLNLSGNPLSSENVKQLRKALPNVRIVFRTTTILTPIN